MKTLLIFLYQKDKTIFHVSIALSLTHGWPYRYSKLITPGSIETITFASELSTYSTLRNCYSNKTLLKFYHWAVRDKNKKFIYNNGVLTINTEFMWRGLETGERTSISESFQPYRAESHKFYIYHQYTNIVFILQ